MRRISFLFASLFAAASLASPAGAHSMYQAAVLLDVHGSTIDAELQLPLSRLETALGGPLSQAAIAQEGHRITAYLLRNFSASLPSGRNFRLEPLDRPSLSLLEGAPYVVAHFRFTPPEWTDGSVFDLHCAFLVDRIPSQVVLVSVRTDWRTSTFANDPQLLGVIREGSLSIHVDRGEGSWWHGFGSVFRLGMRHIAEGTDHLLFLLALLLPAPLVVKRGRWAGQAGVRQCLLQIGRVVTAFTIGHSITLAASALDLLRVPSRPIETLIAVSILVSAVHAMRPLFPGREAVIAGCFGLIHGLAFAATLADLGLNRWDRIASIFGFNLGIETMQLVVVAATMPSLILLSRAPVYPAIRILGASFAGIAAVGWMGERLWNIANPADSVVEAVAQRAAWVAVTLTLLGLFGRFSSSTPLHGEAAAHTAKQ